MYQRLSTTNHCKVINVQKWSGFFGPPCIVKNLYSAFSEQKVEEKDPKLKKQHKKLEQSFQSQLKQSSGFQQSVLVGKIGMYNFQADELVTVTAVTTKIFNDICSCGVCLSHAGRYADVQVAGYLIDKGRASIHVTSNSGATALHYAARYGNLGESVFTCLLSLVIY